MNKIKLKHHTLITGTLMLTAAGICTRFVGFFYRIFLSRLIGAEGLGVYQLLSPVTALGFSLTTAGIQTAISRYVSMEMAKKRPERAIGYLKTGLMLSSILSISVGIVLWTCSDLLSVRWLGEPRTAPLIKILAFTFAPCCIHACINGYYYGIKKTAIPSACQLAEQLARVGSVCLMYLISQEKNIDFDLTMAIWGLVIGEAASTLVSVTFFISGSENENAGKSSAVCGISGELPEGKYLKSLLAMAVPLTASRVTLNLFATFENSLIPLKLKAFGYSPSDALSVYGILTGMAMSVVMFPSVITNSVSVLLMPTISEARASCNGKLIDKAISGSIRYCMVLGFICTAGFLAAGSFLGNYLFANALAGSFIKTLGFICPFLYLTATLNSIMHGLGYPNLTFFLGGISCVIRILFVIFAIPFFGIKGYLAGLLASQIITAALTLIILKCKVKNRQI